MTALTQQLPHQLVRAAHLLADLPHAVETPVPAGVWRPAELVGRLSELTAAAHSVHLTLACSIIRQFQSAAEPVAWITTSLDLFFPPDMARAGVDLAALPIVHVPDLPAVVTVADRLTRSGAFGLLLLELGAGRLGAGRGIPAAVLGRLVRLARRHDTALVCLTTPDAHLGSMVSLRGRGVRSAARRCGYFRCGIQVTKDRLRGPGWSLTDTYRGPHGVC